VHAHALNNPNNARVLLVGAGVAGVSTALWLHDLKVPFRWIDAAPHVGGTLHRIHHPIRNLAGRRWPHGVALVDALVDQLAHEGLAPELGVHLTQLDPEHGHVTLNATPAHYPAVVLATGTRPRRLGLASEADLDGRGVYRSTHRWASSLTGRRAVVVGGGDGGCEGALILARAGVHVTLVHRRAHFRARAEFVEGVRAHPGVTPALSARVSRLAVGQGCLGGVGLSTLEGERLIAVSGPFGTRAF